jgi:hypothetical protein
MGSSGRNVTLTNLKNGKYRVVASCPDCTDDNLIAVSLGDVAKMCPSLFIVSQGTTNGIAIHTCNGAHAHAPDAKAGTLVANSPTTGKSFDVTIDISSADLSFLSDKKNPKVVNFAAGSKLTFHDVAYSSYQFKTCFITQTGIVILAVFMFMFMN